MQSVEFLAFGSFHKFQIFFHFSKSRFFFISQNPFFFISQNPDFFHFAKSIFFSFHKIQIYRLATSFSDSGNSPLECKLFLLSECLITSYVYLCLIFTIGSFRKIQIFFISQNPVFFFSFHKIQIYRLATSSSDTKIVPWNARSFYYQNAPSHHMFTFV